MRSGTLPTPLVVGLGAACKVAGEEMENDRAHAAALSKRLIDGEGEWAGSVWVWGCDGDGDGDGDSDGDSVVLHKPNPRNLRPIFRLLTRV